MIKYKLIKEYPTSPELGTILSGDNNKDTCESKGDDYGVQLMYVKDYPEYGKQVEDFKVGEYVILNERSEEYHNKVLKIVRVKYDTVCYFNGNGVEESFESDIANVRLATSEEIIKHYEEQGGVKGAKFRCGIDAYSISELQYCNGNVHVKLNKADEGKEINCCKLIKEPDYPKSGDDLYMVGYFGINEYSKIVEEDICLATNSMKNLYFTEKQAKSALAFAQLTQLRKVMIDKYNEFYNINWKGEPDGTDKLLKYCIVRIENDISIDYFTTRFQHLAFPTKELAEFSLQHHNNLGKQYYELD